MPKGVVTLGFWQRKEVAEICASSPRGQGTEVLGEDGLDLENIGMGV